MTRYKRPHTGFVWQAISQWKLKSTKFSKKSFVCDNKSLLWFKICDNNAEFYSNVKASTTTGPKYITCQSAVSQLQAAGRTLSVCENILRSTMTKLLPIIRWGPVPQLLIVIMIIIIIGVLYNHSHNSRAIMSWVQRRWRLSGQRAEKAWSKKQISAVIYLKTVNEILSKTVIEFQTAGAQ